MGLVGTVKPAVDDRVRRIADQVVVLTRLDHQHLARVHRFAAPIDLNLALALHNAKDLTVIVDVYAFAVCAEPHGVETEATVDNILARNQLGRDVLGALCP
jgi:hypothetical protein